MNRCVVLLMVTIFGLGCLFVSAAEETTVQSRVVAVGLFKNGLATIKREVKLPGPGTYRIDAMPEPVHGTWWVESDSVIETRTTTREVEGINPKMRERQVVLLLTVPENAKAATVLLTYLTKGIAWAPSYRVDITDPKELNITQTAVIKNELCDLEGADIQLITGFPNIQFANVVSPLSPRTTWATFFQQLNTRFADGHTSMLNSVARQQREPVSNNNNMDISAASTGEGVDIHYQPVGKRTWRVSLNSILALGANVKHAPLQCRVTL
ncbi:MAG: hypothetical protein V1899_05000 [Planctomycetota bacterium]